MHVVLEPVDLGRTGRQNEVFVPDRGQHILWRKTLGLE